jgi:hypothetical protein
MATPLRRTGQAQLLTCDAHFEGLPGVTLLVRQGKGLRVWRSG